MRTFLLAMMCVCASGQVQTMLKNDANGTFELMGSLCFPGSGETSTIKMELTGHSDAKHPTTPTTILLFDNEPQSFAKVSQVMANGDARTCRERSALAKQMHKADGSMSVIQVLPGKTTSTEIAFTEHFPREWFFVASICPEDSGAKVGLSYSITSDGAISCTLMHKESSTVGYDVAITFLTIISVALVGVTIVFYRRSTIPVVAAIDETGYNEL